MDSEYKQIQLGIDSILNTKTFIRRKKKAQSDKKRELFHQVINGIDELNNRQTIMYADLDLDFSNYDEKYFAIIDSLLYINFGKECMDLIGFYLYDRINIDGTINPLIINDSEELIITNPYELWNLLCQINPKLSE
jgi:hypothetical protein